MAGRGANGGRALCASVALGAFLLRVVPLLHGVAFAAADYDEGVYFSASSALVHGRMPYRDFVFLHPPGLLLLIAPLARLTTGPDGFLVARLLACLAAAATTAVVFLAGRRLHSRSVGFLAAAMYAGYVPAVFAEGRILLDPFLNLLAVSGGYLFLTASAEHRRRALWAGFLLGLATTTKLYGAIYLVGVGATCLVDGDADRWRRAGRTVAAATVSFAVVTAPFVVLASPGAFLSQTVTAQVQRPPGGALPGNTDGLWPRAASMFGLGPLGGRARPPAVAVALLVLAAGSVLWGLARRDRDGLLWATVAGIGAVLFLAGSSFYAQYGVFVAPAICLLFSGATVTLVGTVVEERRQFAGALVAGTLLIAWQAPEQLRVLRAARPPDPSSAIVAMGRAGCVYAEPSYLAVAAGLRSQAGSPHPLVDPFGELLYLGERGSSSVQAALRSDAAQARLADALRACPVIVLDSPPGAQLTWSSYTAEASVASHRLTSRVGRIEIWSRADRE